MQTVHNIGILAHVDAGKTTLTEQLLYFTGSLRIAGSVDSGTAATDSLAVEKQRGISVRSAAAGTFYKDTVLNIIDTPGHTDFAGEVERALYALDYAVVVVSGVDGVRAHTENIIQTLKKSGLPFCVFINKTDLSGSDSEKIREDIERVSERKCLFISRSENEGSADVKIRERGANDFLAYATAVLADINEEAEEVFLNDGVLKDGEITRIIRSSVYEERLIPVFSGSAKFSLGIKELVEGLIEYMPSSERRKTEELSGIIYKIERDKTFGKVAHIRMFEGELTNRSEVDIISPGEMNKKVFSDAVTEEKPPLKGKISRIRKFSGVRLNDADSVRGGEIAAVFGLSDAKTGYFIGSAPFSDSARLVYPFLRVKVTPADGDISKLSALAGALGELSDEEPYLDVKWENGLSEITVNTTGKIQLEVLSQLLKERYELDAIFSPPTVIYKETPRIKASGGARYTMPKPCWACVDFMIEPMERGYGVSYHGKLPFDQCKYQYQAHIHTSFLNTCIPQGLFGWEVTDFKCTLTGGEHHLIHTHPLDFFVATPMAFMDALTNCGSVILEPVIKIRITAPSDLSGKILSEIISMDGEYDTPVIYAGNVCYEAVVPVAKSMDLPVKLSIISGGKAVLNSSFYGYRECKDGCEHLNPRRGVDPRDRSKWILWARGALI